MDAISALDVAGGILTITEFSVELLSTSNSSKVLSSVDENATTSIIEDLRKLWLSLSGKRDVLQQRLPKSLSPLLEDELALLELGSSSLKDSGVLLEVIESNSDKSPGTWARSEVAERFSIGNLNLVSQPLTRHVTFILE